MFKSPLLNSSPWIAAFRRGLWPTELMWPAGCGSCNGVLWGHGIGIFDSDRSSIGIKCWITLFRSWFFPLPLDTLTIAALTFPSLPGINCSTLPSFQNALEVESFLRMTMSPTVIAVRLPLTDLAVEFSRKLNKYSRFHCFENCCSSCLWCRYLLVRVLWVLMISKYSSFGIALILWPLIKWEGVRGCEIDSSSS